MAPDLDDVLRALSVVRPASSDHDLNPGLAPPAGACLRPAAVLVALQRGTAGWEVLLTKRSSQLRHHPGQIAFPGGKLDPDDADAEACALREAHEEVRLPPGNARVLGRLASHVTVTGYDVVPVLAEITAPFDPVPDRGEVAEIFTVPLGHVLDLAKYRVESRRWQGRRRHYYVVPYGPYYIWGATARMLRGLADRFAACA